MNNTFELMDETYFKASMDEDGHGYRIYSTNDARLRDRAFTGAEGKGLPAAEQAVSGFCEINGLKEWKDKDDKWQPALSSDTADLIRNSWASDSKHDRDFTAEWHRRTVRRA